MPKLKIYVETSVISGLTDEDPPERRAVAKALFASIAEGTRFAAHISSLVVEEIMRGPEDLVREFDALTRQLEFALLEPTAEAEDLAEWYILEAVISERHRNDAVHLAIATVAELDVVLVNGDTLRGSEGGCAAPAGLTLRKLVLRSLQGVPTKHGQSAAHSRGERREPAAGLWQDRREVARGGVG